MRLIRPTVAAAQIHNYLQTIPDDHTSIDLKPLETFIADVCSRVENATLLNILEDYGWDGESSQFDPNRIDIPGLRVALSRKSLLLTTRTSQLGPNLSPKSFAPAMLLSYLCYLANKEHSYSVDLRGSYIVSGDRPNQTEIAAAAAAAAAIQGETINIKLSPASFFFRGVCLLVDISGFTRLSGSFCALGKVGIDGLQQATNGYMGSLVEVIYKYGGDIIKFAGDAIICVFLEKDVRKSISAGHGSGISHQPSSKNQCVINQNVCILAMHCAMRLREICTETLTVHVAVSCGEMCFGIVGGCNDKWECLISGDCLMELSQCLEDAPSKQVAVTGYFGEVVGSDILHDFGGEVLPSGNYRLTMKPNETSQLESEDEDMIIDWVIQSSRPEYMKAVNMFVPLPVTLAFESGGLRYLAEIREVTTMFMKWDSYNTTDYADLVQLQRPFLECQTILHELGGFVRQFLVDDKGCVLIACWGVPTAAFLNNAHRALSAAAKIRAKFHELSLQCSIGITTGNVYCGNVGSEIRREYAAVGDVVNLSARLMSKAHGGIYIDEATYSRLAVTLWSSFDVLEPLRVKGKSEPVLAYAYQLNAEVPELPEPAIEEYEIKTVCRTVLTRLLERLWLTAGGLRSAAASLAGGRSTNAESSIALTALHMVVLEGRVGSGKGTTIKWIMRKAQERREIRVVRVNNLEPRDTMLEYRAVSRILIELIGPNHLADMHKQRMVVTHILNAIYGDNHEIIDKVAMPALRTILGNVFGMTNLPMTATGESTRTSHTNAINDRSVVYTTKRLPPKIISDTMRDILAYYFAEDPTVLLIENIHYCDDSSMKCLMNLRDLPVPGLVVMTTLSVEDLQVDLAKIHDRRGSISRHAMLALEHAGTINTRRAATESLETFRTVMSQHQHCTYIRLDDFNVSEIDAMIRAALNVQTVPLGLAQWVQQLSGGSIYWINEMLEFLKSTGIDEFMNITIAQSPEKMRNIRRHSATPHKSIRHMPWMVGDGKSIHVPASGSSPVEPRKTFRITAANTDSPTASPSTSTHFGFASPKAGLMSPGGNNMNNESFFHDAKMSQLEHFIISRFEKLPLDDQRILKKASVIGLEFSRYVLYSILPVTLKSQLHAALKNLVKENWITPAGDSSSGGGQLTARDSNVVGGGNGSGGVIGGINSNALGAISTTGSGDAEYAFCHPLAWETLYELIPPGDRKGIHRSVAEYYETMAADGDGSLYERISSHYAYCDTAKAFEYSLRGVMFNLQSLGDQDLQEGLNLILFSMKYINCVSDVNLVQMVVDHAKAVFHSEGTGGGVGGNSDKRELHSEASFMGTTGGAVSRSQHHYRLAVGHMQRMVFCLPHLWTDLYAVLGNRDSRGGSRIADKRGSWWNGWGFASCGIRGNAVVPINNSISYSLNNAIPVVGRMRLNSSGRAGSGNGFDLMDPTNKSSKSNRSFGSLMSHMSIQSFNDAGREYVMRVFQHIDRQLASIKSHLISDGRIGSFTNWQKELIKELPSEDVDEGIVTLSPRPTS